MPVIVVGNITVGGTGKTSVVIWLANFLRVHGLRVGVVCSGYGGDDILSPVHVKHGSCAYRVGDEAVHIQRRTECVVVSCRYRAKAARYLEQKFDLDVLICDDGLQHYQLIRDIEVHVVNGDKRFGNGYFLPAGPLRESINRLKDIELKVAKGSTEKGEYCLSYKYRFIYKVNNPCEIKDLYYFKGKKFLAVSGIANPEEFFKILEHRGLSPIKLSYPDHHRFESKDFVGYENIPILMTEKDAVKCESILGYDFWSVSLEYCLPRDFGDAIVRKLEYLKHG